MRNKQTARSEFGGQHAVVIGASMAGLLASRVLADHFDDECLPRREIESNRRAGK